MKKLFFVALALTALLATSCKQEPRTAPLAETSQRDSLQKIIDQKDNEINDMMATLNQIQDGFREIAEAENRLSIVKDGERTNKAQQIRENIQFISNTMKQCERRCPEGHHRWSGEATRGERPAAAAASCRTRFERHPYL